MTFSFPTPRPLTTYTPVSGRATTGSPTYVQHSCCCLQLVSCKLGRFTRYFHSCELPSPSGLFVAKTYWRFSVQFRSWRQNQRQTVCLSQQKPVYMGVWL